MSKLIKKVPLTDSTKKQIKKLDFVTFVVDAKKAPIKGQITDIIGAHLAVKVGSDYYECLSSEVTKV